MAVKINRHFQDLHFGFEASKYLHFKESYGPLKCFYALLYLRRNTGKDKSTKLNSSKITCTLKVQNLMAANNYGIPVYDNCTMVLNFKSICAELQSVLSFISVSC